MVIVAVSHPFAKNAKGPALSVVEGMGSPLCRVIQEGGANPPPNNFRQPSLWRVAPAQSVPQGPSPQTGRSPRPHHSGNPLARNARPLP